MKDNEMKVIEGEESDLDVDLSAENDGFYDRDEKPRKPKGKKIKKMRKFQDG